MIVSRSPGARLLTRTFCCCCLAVRAPLSTLRHRLARTIVSSELEILALGSVFVYFAFRPPMCQEKLRAKMPGLQPVLKMKVDELFFKWLSDPATQTQLKQYLELIKSGQIVDLANGTAEDKNSPFGENNNVTSNRSHAGKKPAAISIPCSHPSTGALPSGSSGNPRVSGHSGRTLRKSLSTKKVKRLLSVSCKSIKLAFIHFCFQFTI